jgi:hypothetical protein
MAFALLASVVFLRQNVIPFTLNVHGNIFFQSHYWNSADKRKRKGEKPIDSLLVTGEGPHTAIEWILEE